MSTAIINGIKNRNDIDIYGYSKDLKKLEINAKELNIKICSDFNEFKDFDFIFLGVKPNNLNDISEITDFGEKPIILSMLSGIKLEKLIKAFPKNKNIIRIMPNINARIQKSVTGFISKNNIEMEFAVSILNSFGSSFLIEEDKFSEFSVFAGCLPAYTFLFIESLMYDGQSLQAGTSHYFGQNFSKPFNIKFQTKEQKEEFAFTTSWGASTRLIGAIIMTHSDDNGLVLPSKISPVQIQIINVKDTKEINEVSDSLVKLFKDQFRVKVDNSDKSFGFKISEAEIKGIPIRIEIGPRDLENGLVTISRRDQKNKVQVELKNLAKLLEFVNEQIKEYDKTEARERTAQMLNVYADFAKEYLLLPIIKGKKTEKEKFAGALETYTIESLMYDGQSLQAGTSHYFGQNFSKPFNIKFQTKEQKEEFAFTTSWGASTRLIGAIIMTHSDDNGLVLPSKISPVQIQIINVKDTKEINEVSDSLVKLFKDQFRVKVDNSDKSFGFKISEAEIKGIPIRIEIGPRDLENGLVTISRRDQKNKVQVELKNLAKLLEFVNEQIKEYDSNLFAIALKNREKRTFKANSLEEYKNIINKEPGFVLVPFCGQIECENKVKEETQSNSRCIPEGVEQKKSICFNCKNESNLMVYFGKAY
ncbi:hypothetical protein FQR65_LT17095 [Abscondita terminalis]|nr:hypothetical protein FQR65_LT17095 [Abscondita terminalis]